MLKNRTPHINSWGPLSWEEKTFFFLFFFGGVEIIVSPWIFWEATIMSPLYVPN